MTESSSSHASPIMTGERDHKVTFVVGIAIEIAVLTLAVLAVVMLAGMIAGAHANSQTSSDAGVAPEVAAAIIGALTSVVVAWPIARAVAWRAERKGYEYERSARITGERFSREIACIDGLSAALYEYQSCALEYAGGEHVECKRDRCDGCEIEENARVQLAKSALFLHYLDDCGQPYCGVKVRKGCSSGECSTTLHERGDETYKLAKRTLAGKAGEGDAEKLEARYERFRKCANCRIRSIETGRRDAHRIAFKNALPMHRLLDKISEHYDPVCPYVEGGESRQNCSGATSKQGESTEEQG